MAIDSASLDSLTCIAFDRVISTNYSTINSVNCLRISRFWNVLMGQRKCCMDKYFLLVSRASKTFQEFWTLLLFHLFEILCIQTLPIRSRTRRTPASHRRNVTASVSCWREGSLTVSAPSTPMRPKPTASGRPWATVGPRTSAGQWKCFPIYLIV